MLKLFKNNFSSIIGNLYYIWTYSSINGEILVAFLGNNKKKFDKFIQKIKINFHYSLIEDKKSYDIELKILNYLSGKCSYIDLKPLFLTGSEFAKKIWNITMSIPFGECVSYKELTQMAGYKKAWRASGSALKQNPVMLIVPCHRVIKSNGDIGFFNGGVKVKRVLLEIEGSLVK